jgi:hypothetical protein
MFEKKNELITEKRASRRSILKWTATIATATVVGAVGNIFSPTTVTAASSSTSDVGAPDVDLRPIISQIGLKVRNQKTEDWCAAYALNFLLEYMYITRFASNFSEDYLEYVTFQIEKPKMKGGENFWALNIGYQKWGIVPEAFVSDQEDLTATIQNVILQMGKDGIRMKQVFIKNWDNTTGATQDQLNQAINYLDQNTPVAIGLLWPKNFKTQQIGGVDVMEVPSAANKWDVVFDGHAVALVGYKSDASFPGNGYFIYRNSWGEKWGDQGYGYVPFEYVLQYANDLCVYQMPTP